MWQIDSSGIPTVKKTLITFHSISEAERRLRSTMVLATIIHNCAKYITNIIFKFTVAGATPKAELSSPEKSLPMFGHLAQRANR